MYYLKAPLKFLRRFTSFSRHNVTPFPRRGSQNELADYGKYDVSGLNWSRIMKKPTDFLLNDWLVRLSDGICIKNGAAKVINLPQRLLTILLVLCQSQEQPVKRRVIARAVYDDGQVKADRLLRKDISRLRKLLGNDCIQTKYGQGYSVRAVVVDSLFWANRERRERERRQNWPPVHCRQDRQSKSCSDRRL